MLPMQPRLKLAREGRPIMALPMGHELKTIGLSPEQHAVD
jgi:hypothetical protein